MNVPPEIEHAWRENMPSIRNFLSPDFPTIVVLCGSTRFYEEFQAANYRETMAGRIVLSVGHYPNAAKEAHGENVGCTPEQKVALDELHKRKIDVSDEILVLNCPWWRCKTCRMFAPSAAHPCLTCKCGPDYNRGEWAPYIGASTRSEIEYAIAHGKKVRYLNDPG